MTAEAKGQQDSVRIGVVASLKKGMEQFIYRELCHMESCGAQIRLFPTKQGKGLYAPKPEWNVVAWSIWRVLLWQPMILAASPFKYLKVLLIAIKFRALGDFALAAFFAKQIQDLDVIYSTFGDRKLFVAYFAKLLTGRPMMCTVHAYELYDNPNDPLFRESLRSCDQIFTISKFNQRLLCDKFEIPPSKIEIATYSIDLEDYKPCVKFSVLIVGFFVARKGHEILFKAIQHLNNPDIEVWVVGGEGAETGSVDVRAMAQSLGIERQVSFFGKQSGNALRSLYHACDLFCLPCHFDDRGVGEGFPNVIIEAMAVGKPVVSSEHVGIPEILEQFCIAERDHLALAQAIDQLYKNSHLRSQLGRRNRELAEVHFSSENVRPKVTIAKQLSLVNRKAQSQ